MTASDILWLIFEICINLFQGFAITWFLDRVLTRNHHFSLLSYAACVLFVALSLSTYLFFPMPSNDTWIMIFPFLYTLLFYKNAVIHKFFWVAVAYLVVSSCSYFSIWVMETFFNIDLAVLYANSFSRFVYVVTGNLNLFILYFLISKFAKTHLKNLLPLAMFVAIVILLLLVGDAQYAIYAYADRSDFLSQFSSALILVITILTIILYFIMSNYAQAAAEKKLLETKITQETQRMEDLQQVSNSLHVLRHDLRNQLNIAADLMQKGNAAESRQHLAQIDSRILQIFSTGCPALDSALYLKQQEMQHRGILFQSLITPITTLPLTAYELCSIVINLMDNAIEAEDRFPKQAEHYTVTLSIHRQANMLVIECSNPVYEPSLTIKDGKFLTSKSENGHGKGIAAIESILSHMDAQSSFTVEDGIFKALILLPYWGEIDADLPHGEAVKQRNAVLKAHARSNTWWARLKRELVRRRAWKNI